MDIFANLEKQVLTILADYAGDAWPGVVAQIKFSVPPAKMRADYSTNAAMVLAKVKKMPPPQIASELKGKLETIANLSAVKIVGGYLNFVLSDTAWQEFLQSVIKQKSNFGSGEPREKVLLEFISANPTGPLHIGHTRGAILGLALDKLLTKAGYQVTTEYYINDYGVQIKTLLRSLQWRYQQACGQDLPMPEGAYPGEYLIPVARQWHQQYGDRFVNTSEEAFYQQFKDEAVHDMMTIIKNDVASLGLVFDNFVSETAIVESGAIEQALENLAHKSRTITDDEGHTQTLSLLYQGKLDAPVGRPANEQEQEDSRHDDGDQTLFRSTLFGDDRDRVVRRSDGTTTYFTSDIAYHDDKIRRSYPILINLFGADHGGYVKRLTGAVEALSDGQTKLEIHLMQLVALEKNGQPFKMSKRAGNFVLLSDVVKEVDVDELKLFILAKSADTPMTFDLVKVKEKSKDNVVYYIQYAATRTFSLGRKYAAIWGQTYDYRDSDLTQLPVDDKSIRQLVILLARYPSVIQTAARHRAPYILVTYLQELASHWHGLWSTDLQLINPADETATRAMMALTAAVQTVIVDGLACLGITAKKEM